MGQIALPLAAAGEGRFVIGAGNAAVVEALRAPGDWPFRTAILTGPPRSGRSSLARWFAAERSGEAVDDAQLLDETQLFHRWNGAQASGTALLLVAPVEDWHIALPDLASRLAAALPLTIAPPDDAMFAELLLAHAEARRLALGDDGAAYLAARAERSYLAAERLVAVIDRLSLERKAAPGPAIWRDALEELAGGEAQKRLL